MADFQSTDPEELQVPDIFLPVQLVVRAPIPNALRHTEGSLQMTSSPSLGHTQQSNA
jgi:hypothetical protein